MSAVPEPSRHDWPYLLRFLVLGMVFTCAAFVFFADQWWSWVHWGPVSAVKGLQIISMGLLLTIWIPAVLARLLGRRFRRDRLVAVLILTVFLGYEVQSRAAAQAGPVHPWGC